MLVADPRRLLSVPCEQSGAEARHKQRDPGLSAGARCRVVPVCRGSVPLASLPAVPPESACRMSSGRWTPPATRKPGRRLPVLSNLDSVVGDGAETSVQPARAALAEVLADGAIRAARQAMGADALVAWQAPAFTVASLVVWTISTTNGGAQSRWCRSACSSISGQRSCRITATLSVRHECGREGPRSRLGRFARVSRPCREIVESRSLIVQGNSLASIGPREQHRLWPAAGQPPSGESRDAGMRLDRDGAELASRESGRFAPAISALEHARRDR